MIACPACEQPAAPTAGSSLIACTHCRVRFLAPLSASATLLTVGIGTAESAREVVLSAELRALYRIGMLLGAGAHGCVYRAVEIATGREVAVKLLKETKDPETLRRFLKEAQLLRKIASPHVLAVLDAGDSGGHPYLVTELAARGSLDDLLAEGPLPLGRAIPLIRDVLAGLEACHSHGIVHRDVKPANVLLDEQGRARIADLGIAKDFGDTAATATGVVVGTPAYMAPEQLAGEVPQVATDVYAAGMLLYRMLVGKLPFARASIPDVVAFHQRSGRLKRADLPAGLPGGVTEAIERALATDRTRRPPSAADFSVMLERAARAKPAEPTPAPPPEAPGRFKLPPGVYELILLAVLIAGGLAMRPKDPWAGMRDPLEPTPVEAPGGPSQLASPAALASPGSPAAAQLEPLPRGEGLLETTTLLSAWGPGRAPAGAPPPSTCVLAFSADSLALHRFDERGEIEWSVSTGELRSRRELAARLPTSVAIRARMQRFEDPTGWLPSEAGTPVDITPDGRQVLATRGDRLQLVDVAARRVLKQLPPGKPAREAALSSDARVAVTITGDELRVFDLGLDPPAETYGTYLQRRLEGLAISPDGRLYATIERYYPEGVVVHQRNGKGGRYPHGKHRVGPRPIAPLVFSPDGRLLASATESGDVLVWRVGSP